MDNTHKHELIGDDNYCVVCGPEKKAVTREDLADIFHVLSFETESGKELIEQLLTERDEALKSNETLEFRLSVCQKADDEIIRLEREIAEERRWKEAYRVLAIDCDHVQCAERTDREAKQIVAEKK